MKIIFEVIVEPKGPYKGPTFRQGIEPLEPLAPKIQNLYISTKIMISQAQSIDNIFLSVHEKCQRNWSKMAQLWPKNVCP